MKRLLLSTAMTTLGLLAACSSGPGDPVAEATASQAAGGAASDADVVQDGSAFSSKVSQIAFDVPSPFRPRSRRRGAR